MTHRFIQKIEQESQSKAQGDTSHIAELEATVVELETEHKNLCNTLLAMDEPPFTIQRICELVHEPNKYYDKCNAFFRALEKNLRVISPHEEPKPRPEPTFEQKVYSPNHDGNILQGKESFPDARRGFDNEKKDVNNLEGDKVERHDEDDSIIRYEKIEDKDEDTEIKRDIQSEEHIEIDPSPEQQDETTSEPNSVLVTDTQTETSPPNNPGDQKNSGNQKEPDVQAEQGSQTQKPNVKHETSSE